MNKNTWTYSQWFQFLNELHITSPDRDVLFVIAKKKLSHSAQFKDRLNIPLRQAVESMLHRSIENLLYDLNQLLEMQEYGCIEYCLERFRLNLEEVCFYRELSFISEEEKNALDDWLLKAIEIDWKNQYIKWAYNAALDYKSIFAEDLIYLLEKERLIETL